MRAGDGVIRVRLTAAVVGRAMGRDVARQKALPGPHLLLSDGQIRAIKEGRRGR